MGKPMRKGKRKEEERELARAQMNESLERNSINNLQEEEEGFFKKKGNLNKIKLSYKESFNIKENKLNKKEEAQANI